MFSPNKLLYMDEAAPCQLPDHRPLRAFASIKRMHHPIAGPMSQYHLKQIVVCYLDAEEWASGPAKNGWVKPNLFPL